MRKKGKYVVNHLFQFKGILKKAFLFSGRYRRVGDEDGPVSIYGNSGYSAIKYAGEEVGIFKIEGFYYAFLVGMDYFLRNELFCLFLEIFKSALSVLIQMKLFDRKISPTGYNNRKGCPEIRNYLYLYWSAKV